MKKNEIKKMVEQVVKVEYIAEDGIVFYNEEDCKKYEESALFKASNKLKRTSMHALNEELSDECELEIFNVQTKEDLLFIDKLYKDGHIESEEYGEYKKKIEMVDEYTDGLCTYILNLMRNYWEERREKKYHNF